MAEPPRHAAWRNPRTFAVKLQPQQGAPIELANGFSDFLDAFDFASDWLAREDPGRDGTAGLAIVETRDGVTEEVWTYPVDRRHPPLERDDLVKLFGFDPFSWNARLPPRRITDGG